jgi:hypothetical protein
MQANREVRIKVADSKFACLRTIETCRSPARLKVELPIQVGTKIELIFEQPQQNFYCTVARSIGDKIGVAFVIPSFSFDAEL